MRDKLHKRKSGEAKTPVSPCDPVRPIPDYKDIKMNSKEKGKPSIQNDF